jgi:hypothetical protein
MALGRMWPAAQPDGEPSMDGLSVGDRERAGPVAGVPG